MDMSRKWLILILLLASVSVHFAFFGQPDQVVFDEVHFGKFISAYYTHQYYFDIHPPLGKLLIAGMGKLSGFQPEYGFANIGQAFPDKGYLALRFLPTIAGALLPIIIFLFALELGMAPVIAFFAGMMVVLDNALLTQSRYILLDPFLLLFGFGGLYSYFRWRNKKNKWFLLVTGLCLGLSASIKWTGLGFLAIILIAELIHLWQDRRGTALRRLHAVAITLIVIPFVVYFSVFLIHFSLLTKSGEGDAFMTPEFRSGLVGTTEYQDPAYQPLNSFEKFVELNKEMYTANKTLTATHPYGSKWYTWPLMIRPIYYWNAPDNSGQPTSIEHPPAERKIYLVGNPLVWWGSTVATLYILLTSLFALFKRERFLDRTGYILLGGWLINFLPFIGIGRVMFLYHYLAGLIFAVLMFAYALNQTRRPHRAVWIILAIATLLFIFFAPLSYGLPLTGPEFSLRIWLTSWQ